MLQFNLSEDQLKKADEWMKQREKYVGAIGGQFTFKFTPTGLGVIVVISDAEGSLDLTNYDLW